MALSQSSHGSGIDPSQPLRGSKHMKEATPMVDNAVSREVTEGENQQVPVPAQETNQWLTSKNHVSLPDMLTTPCTLSKRHLK